MNTIPQSPNSSMPQAFDRYLIPNLARACRMLDLLSAARAPLTATQIARQLGMPRTSAFRALRTMCSEGIVTESDKGYLSGFALVRIGIQALNNQVLRQHAPTVLKSLAGATGESSHIGVAAGQQVINLDVFDSTVSGHVAPRAGTLMDLHTSALGKVLLAYLPQPKLEGVLANLELPGRTKASITDPDRLREELKRVRNQGYGLDNEESATGVRNLAAPVHDTNWRVIAAIGISAPVANLTLDKVPKLADQIIEHSSALTEKLGPGGGTA